MKIIWLGQSSFLIEDSKGTKFLTDPFDGSVGYKVYTGNADIVTISHHHFDHDYIKEVKGDPKIIEETGSFNVKGIPITGISSYHDDVMGAKRGKNIIFKFEMDGYKLCHLGDLGHLLSKDYIQKIGDVDILFIPVGGNFTIDSKEASRVAKDIKSHVVIPMHYKTRKTSLPIDGVENFLTCMKNCKKVSKNTWEVDKDLKDYNQVKLFSLD